MQPAATKNARPKKEVTNIRMPLLSSIAFLFSLFKTTFWFPFLANVSAFERSL